VITSRKLNTSAFDINIVCSVKPLAVKIVFSNSSLIEMMDEKRNANSKLPLQRVYAFVFSIRSQKQREKLSAHKVV
jgi:hypothetical protein